MADRIASRNYCNSLVSGVFTSELNGCPPWSEINATGKFIISGTYATNQLVKEIHLSVKSSEILNFRTYYIGSIPDYSDLEDAGTLILEDNDGNTIDLSHYSDGIGDDVYNTLAYDSITEALSYMDDLQSDTLTVYAEDTDHILGTVSKSSVISMLNDMQSTGEVGSLYITVKQSNVTLTLINSPTPNYISNINFTIDGIVDSVSNDDGVTTISLSTGQHTIVIDSATFENDTYEIQDLSIYLGSSSIVKNANIGVSYAFTISTSQTMYIYNTWKKKSSSDETVTMLVINEIDSIDLVFAISAENHRINSGENANIVFPVAGYYKVYAYRSDSPTTNVGYTLTAIITDGNNVGTNFAPWDNTLVETTGTTYNVNADYEDGLEITIT